MLRGLPIRPSHQLLLWTAPCGRGSALQPTLETATFLENLNTMTTWKLIGYLTLGAAVLTVLANARDIKRYVRMCTM